MTGKLLMQEYIDIYTGIGIPAIQPLTAHYMIYVFNLLTFPDLLIYSFFLC